MISGRALIRAAVLAGSSEGFSEKFQLFNMKLHLFMISHDLMWKWIFLTAHDLLIEISPHSRVTSLAIAENSESLSRRPAEVMKSSDRFRVTFTSLVTPRAPLPRHHLTTDTLVDLNINIIRFSARFFFHHTHRPPQRQYVYMLRRL